ncbi:hypothetical protein BDV25DRAFT_161021 [Aspergillus avenaceus]|uniref:RlpA-like double-psi beta-barrel-protein domain-containing protein-containing protein n=1 Tax=Aspergillus avenaceus TaxID=36643 RepID=A0A5N6TL89_ASPAV|nr:hypothetical protein BDV25DRAFT_161021 [Aspergillus avenaceus]
MAPLSKTIALAGALLAAVTSAVPVQKRDVTTTTSTTIVWSTVTTTIYLTEPTSGAQKPAAPAPAATGSPALVPEQPEAEESDEPSQPAWSPEPETSSYVLPTVAPTLAPQPTTSVAPAPQPTQKPQPSASAPAAVPPQPSTTSIAPQPTGSSGGGGGNGGSSTGPCSKNTPCRGQLTFYDTATDASLPSSCGNTNDGTAEDVIALSKHIMKDSDCGRMVTINYNGIKKSGKVVDKCDGCDSTSIDLSRHLFNSLADEGLGRLFGVEWWFE